MDVVSIVKFYDSIDESIRSGLNLMGHLNISNSTILIKPNICVESTALKNANVSVELVDAIVDEVFKRNKDFTISIVESDSEGKNIDRAFENSGYLQLQDEYRAQGYDVSIVNLSKEPTEAIACNGLWFRELRIPKILLQEKFFISVARAKVHELTTITGILKNQFGCLPAKNKNMYHRQIDKIIVDVNKIIRPDLCIVDGMTGMEGSTRGRVRELGVFICGRNPVSTDAVLARVMGFNPSRIRHILLAERHNLGTLHPQVVGEQVESVGKRFRKPRGIIAKLGVYIPESLRPIARHLHRNLLRRHSD